ncbi:MAG: hypothetical protein R6V21_09315, partial [Pelovirga sp.]
KSFYGHFGILVRAYSYILAMGGDGLKKATQLAVLNANYIRARLEGVYALPYKERSLHEVVFSEENLGGGLPYPRRRQAPDRLRLSSTDHLFSPGGSRGTDGRTDGNRKQTDD